MEKELFYISLSPEIESLLADNEIDIVTELSKTGFDVEKTYGGMPNQDDDSKTKDVTLIILVSAAAFSAVSMSIAHILSTLNSKPVIIKNKKQIPIKDSDGKVLLDKKGKPMLREEIIEQLITPNTPNESTLKTKLGNLFSFEFSTGKKG